MSVTCLLSHTYHDLRCPVCGEGFLVLSGTNDFVTRMQMRRDVSDALRAHHTHLGATDVHSTEPFTIASDTCSAMEWMPSALTFTTEAPSAA